MVSSHAVEPEPLIAPMVALLASNHAEVKRRVCDFICIAAEVDSEVQADGLSKLVLHRD